MLGLVGSVPNPSGATKTLTGVRATAETRARARAGVRFGSGLGCGIGRKDYLLRHQVVIGEEVVVVLRLRVSHAHLEREASIPIRPAGEVGVEVFAGERDELAKVEDVTRGDNLLGLGLD